MIMLWGFLSLTKRCFLGFWFLFPLRPLRLSFSADTRLAVLWAYLDRKLSHEACTNMVKPGHHSSSLLPNKITCNFPPP